VFTVASSNTSDFQNQYQNDGKAPQDWMSQENPTVTTSFHAQPLLARPIRPDLRQRVSAGGGEGAALPAADTLADRPPMAAREIAPGVFTMAASLTQSMARFAADGFQVVDRSTFASRLSNCQTCDELSGAQCRACGCFVHAKAWLPHESCPRGKWSSV